MLLFLFLFATIVVHLFLQYFVIPRLEANDTTRVKTFHRSAVLAIAKYISTTALLASVAYLLIVLILFALSLKNPVTSAELGAAVANIQWFQSKFKIFRQLWMIWLFVMLLLAFIAYRRDKAARDEERANAERKKAEPLPYLPPNEEMEEITRKIHECELKAKRLEQSWVRTDAELAIRLVDFKLEIQELQRQLREADVRRRLPSTPTAEAQPSHSSVRQFFASKGFFKTLQVTTRSLGHVGTILLALSVIGISVRVLDGELKSRELHLSELQIELSKKKARESFEHAMSEAPKDPQPQSLNEEDKQVINEIAHLVEEHFTSASYLQNDKDDDDKKGVVFFTRSSVVRDQIVNDFKRNPVDVNFSDNPGGPNQGPRKPRDGGPGPSGPSGSDGPSRPKDGGPGTGGGEPNPGGGIRSEEPKPPPPPTPTNSDLRSQLGRTDGGPQSALGEQVADSLEKGLKDRRRLLDKIKAKLKTYKASFREPVAPLDLGRFAVAEAIGTAVDNSWQAPNAALEQVHKISRAVFKDVAANVFARAQQSDKAAFGKSVKGIYQTVMYRFFSDLAGPDSLENALGRVRDGVAQEPIMTHQEMEALREVARELPREDSLFADLRAAYKNAPSALPYNEAELLENQKAAEFLRHRVNDKTLFDDLSIVDSYEDHYPGRLGSDTSTPKAKLLAAARPDLSRNDSPQLLAQARDFSSLQKSVDVGGILMGRSADSGSADFRDLRWTVNNNAITLFLRRADGSEIAAGPFEKSLVHQALAYVADDRKVVVTIILGGKDGGRRVLLHPALVDTPLGRDIIEFDNLVFKFVPGTEPHRKQWDKLVGGQLWLYDVAYELRRLSALQRFESKDELTVDGRSALNRLLAWEDKVFTDQKVIEALRPALQDAEGLKRPDRSILAWSSFFDSMVVRYINQCASQSRGEVADFHMCLSLRFSENAQAASFETLEDWLKPAPSPGWRSIAEELPYTSDNDLSFLRHEKSANAADKLWPIQFRYEIAFPANTLATDLLNEVNVDSKPWEFVELRDLIANKVWAGVEADPDLRSLYQRVHDFALLQRLFRTSLEGKLGQRYPVEKLALLMRATAGSVPTIKTPRCDDPNPHKCQ